MARRSILSIAVNGARRQKCDNPAVPISPREIAAVVVESAREGAAIAHVHARAADGSATQDAAVYAEIVKRIEDQSDIIVQVSIGGRGFTTEELLAPLVIAPEMASFPLRVLDQTRADPLAELRHMAARMREHDIRPELDASSSAMLGGALALQRERAFVGSLCFGFVLGDVEDMAEGAKRLLAFREGIPDDAHWWAIKGGRHSLGIAALALSLGGHARTGLEDTLHDPVTGDPAAGNAQLMARLADLSISLGRDPASPRQAREMLGLTRTRTDPPPSHARVRDDDLAIRRPSTPTTRSDPSTR